MSVIGFDIGNETCYIAIARCGGIEVIDNEYSSRMTPSYVGFTGNSRVLGIAARSKLTTNINNTVFGFKTILGKKFSNVLNELKYFSFDVLNLPSDELGIVVRYLNKEMVFSAQQVMAMMLTKLKTLAEAKLGSKVRECVISVPVFYTDRQRRAMLDAAAIADLKVLKLMNEPTAVALFYGFYRQNLFDVPNTVVFIDLGQSSLTVTVGVFIEDKLTIFGCVWNNSVGGRDFDSVLVRYFAEEFKNKYNLDVMSNKKAVMKLMLECESLKKRMSMISHELSLNIDCLMNGVDVSSKMSRELFEQLSSHLLLEIENTMKHLLLQTELDCKDINEVQIVGGSCRIAALRNIIFKVFGQYPRSTLNQDEAVARGCALQCAFLSPILKTKEYIIDDIQPFAIKMSTSFKNTVIHELEVFPRFHKAPACKRITFNFKTPFSLKVFYPDAAPGLDDIGKYHFSGIPSDVNLNDDVRLELISSIDINGIFSVTSATLMVKHSEEAQGMLSKQTAIVPFDENTQSSEDCMKNDDSSEPQSESNTEESEMEKPAQIIKYFDLTIQTDVPSLSNRDLNQLAAKEQEFINADLHEKKKEDLSNVVEEYIYLSRELLNEQLNELVSYDNRNKIFSILDATEAWLNDSDNNNLQEDDYSLKLDELKSHVEPIRERYQQFLDIEEVLSELKNVLELNYSKFQMLTQERECSNDKDDIKSFKEVLDEKCEILTRCLKAISDANLHDQLPLTADAIRTEIHDFREKAKVFFNTPVPKVVQKDKAVGDQERDLGSFSEETILSKANCEQNEECGSSAETSSDIQPPTEEQFSGVKIA